MELNASSPKQDPDPKRFRRKTDSDPGKRDRLSKE
jgi:hypothetical protein